MEQHNTLWKQDIEGYLNHLREEERSKLTILKYDRDIAKFLAFSKGRLDKSALLDWKARLIADGYAPQTINSMLAAVNGLTIRAVGNRR